MIGGGRGCLMGNTGNFQRVSVDPCRLATGVSDQNTSMAFFQISVSIL